MKSFMRNALRGGSSKVLRDIRAAQEPGDGRRKKLPPPLMARLLGSYTEPAKKGEAGDRANGPDFVTEKGGSL